MGRPPDHVNAELREYGHPTVTRSTPANPTPGAARPTGAACPTSSKIPCDITAGMAAALRTSMTQELSTTLPRPVPVTRAASTLPQTDVGLATAVGIHDVNEDQALVATSRGQVLATLQPTPLTAPVRDRALRLLAVVADGMGGHGHGDLASALVVRHVATGMAPHLEHPRPFDAEATLSELLSEAHLQLRDVALRGGIEPHFGTTATVAWVEWPRLVVAHVGDSRLYLGRRGRLRAVTRDHTMAEQLRERGLTEGPAHPRLESTLWNAVNGAAPPQVELFEEVLRPHDTILMCTDGLHGALGEETMARLLWKSAPAPGAAARLVEHAKRTGQRDDVSAVVLRFEGR
ncbi:MAG: serine/threonine-protein phosphatase [Myxococcales bacterium]|nr:serine/threonine-protein phosphatase [Myxococcales bacterium]